MSLNFSPYQENAPSDVRALSPPPNRPFSPASNTRSPPPTDRRSSQTAIASSAGRQSRPNKQASRGYDPIGGADDDDYLHYSGGRTTGGVDEEEGFGSYGAGTREDNISAFETSLPIRLDYEAALCYILFPPAAGVVVLLFEWKSEYVRYHAWQSSLLFGALFVSHYHSN
jgi:hypothetical protein